MGLTRKCVPRRLVASLLVVALLPVSLLQSEEASSLREALERVQARIAALITDSSGQVEERRRLLERIELSISRQLAAETAVTRISQQRKELERQLETAVPETDAPITPDELDRILANAITTRRTAVNHATAVHLLTVQETATRNRLDQVLAAERALAENEQANTDARELARLRVQEATEALKSITADRENVQSELLVQQLAQKIAERDAEAVNLRPLDQDAFAAFLQSSADRNEAISRQVDQTMDALSDQQLVLAEAREERDALPEDKDPQSRADVQIRVDAERTRTARLELQLRALRVEIEANDVITQIWQNRAQVMQTQSLGGTDAIKKLIEETGSRLALGKDYFLTALREAQVTLDSVESRLSSLPENAAGHTWLQESIKDLRATRQIAERSLSAVLELEVFLEASGLQLRHLEEQQSLLRWLEDRMNATLEVVGSIWQFELFTVENTVMVDGQPITGRLGITVQKVGTALLLMTLGIWLAALIAGFVRTVMLRRGTSPTAAALGFRLLNLASIAVLVIIAFSIVNIPLTVFGFVGGALALGVGLGAQNLVNNFISGMILLIERPIEIGHVIEVEGVRGTVRKIASRFSQIRRFDGVDILVPNSELLERQVVNLTLDDQSIRLNLRVGVAYGSPTRETSECLLLAARTHGLVLDSPAPFVLFEEFGDSALVFSLSFWVMLSPSSNSQVIASDLRYMIEKNLREAGITMAFPQRDVHLDVQGPVEVQLRQSDSPSS